MRHRVLAAVAPATPISRSRVVAKAQSIRAQRGRSAHLIKLWASGLQNAFGAASPGVCLRGFPGPGQISSSRCTTSDIVVQLDRQRAGVGVQFFDGERGPTPAPRRMPLTDL